MAETAFESMKVYSRLVDGLLEKVREESAFWERGFNKAMAEKERLRAALREIEQYQHDQGLDIGERLGEIARTALEAQP